MSRRELISAKSAIVALLLMASAACGSTGDTAPSAGSSADANGVDTGTTGDTGASTDAGTPKEDSRVADAHEVLPTRRTWSRNLGGDHTSAFYAMTAVQNQFIAVGVMGTDSGSDLLVTRFTNAGAVVWAKGYGPPGVDDWGNAVAYDGDNGVVVAGQKSTPSSEVQARVVALTGDGNVQWEKGYPDSTSAQGIVRANDGTFLVAGWSWAVGSKYDFWITKLAADGSPVYERTHAYGAGDGDDQAYGVAALTSGGFIVCGEAELDAWVLGLDADGNKLWAWRSNLAKRSGLLRALALPDGGAVLSGFQSGSGYSEGKPWLVKLDSKGELVWESLLDTPHFGIMREVVEAPEGFLGVGFVQEHYVKGATASSWGVVVRYDNDGTVLWEKKHTAGTESSFVAVEVTADGGLMLAGSATLEGGKPYEHGPWLLKLTEDGELSEAAASQP